MKGRGKNLFGIGKGGENLLCGVTSVLFPVTILCYFCAQNINEFLKLWLIFFMLGTLVVLAMLAYCISLLVLRQGFLALVFCVVCWTGCYLEPSLIALFDNIDLYNLRLLCVVLLILAVAVFAVCLLRRIRRDMRKPAALFSTVLTMILAFNLLPIVRAGLSVGTDEQAGKPFYQTDFSIDSKKIDTPNVYWIHPDGMMGVDIIEKYYHDEQPEFLSELTARGFSIDPSAHFDGRTATAYAIAALTSPSAYDAWLSDYTVSSLRDAIFSNRLREVRRHNEMIMAFCQKGYISNVISSASDIYYPALSGGAFYSIENDRDEVELSSEANMDKLVLLQNIRQNMRGVSEFLAWIFEKLYAIAFLAPPSQWFEELLTPTSVGTSQPFSADIPEDQLKQILPDIQNYIPNSQYESKMVRSLYDILYGGGSQDPKLVIIHDFMTHGPFFYDENGALTDHVQSYDVMDYYPQHVFSTKVLIDMIDMILEVDPDAVIVIQADHGLRFITEESAKAAFGEDVDVLELRNSTMSAIRVPEKYQTGEEQYALENPLNMSRYLVNSFVGQNYEYLPPN